MTGNSVRQSSSFLSGAPAWGLIPSESRLLDISDGGKPMLAPIAELREFLDFGGDISQDGAIGAAYQAALSYLDGAQTWLSFTQRRWQWTLAALPQGMAPLDLIMRPLVSVDAVELFPAPGDPLAPEPPGPPSPSPVVPLLTGTDDVEKVNNLIRFHWAGASAPAIPSSILRAGAPTGYIRQLTIPTTAAGHRTIQFYATVDPSVDVVANRAPIIDPSDLPNLLLDVRAPSGIPDFTISLGAWDTRTAAYTYDASDEALAWADAVTALPEAAPECSVALYDSSDSRNVASDDATDERTMLSSDRYVLNAEGLVCPVGMDWPVAADRPAGDAVRVQFTAGWAAGELPADLLWAVKVATKQFYDMRHGGNASEQFMPAAVQALLAPYQSRRSS